MFIKYKYNVYFDLLGNIIFYRWIGVILSIGWLDYWYKGMLLYILVYL